MSTIPQLDPTKPAEGSLNDAMANTIHLLARLARERFYGKVTCEFKEGQIVVIRREETIKP